MNAVRKAIFIDGSFIFHTSMKLNFRIDYKKFLEFMLGNDYLTNATYYTALPPENEIEAKHRAFIKVLKKDVRLKVKSIPLLKINGGGGGNDSCYSKGEDVMLACEMVRGAALDYYDVAVLVSGDGDFVPAVQMVQELGKRILVVSFSHSLNNVLDMEANAVILIDKHMKELSLT